MRHYRSLLVALAVISISCKQEPIESIHIEVRRGHTDRVLKQLRADHGLVNARDEEGNTPLHWAAEYKRKWPKFSIPVITIHIPQDALYGDSPEMVRMLLDFGADVKARNNWGFTPLHFAALKNNYDVTEILLKNGADINAKDNFGRTPMHQVTSFRKREIGVARLLIDAGAEINVADVRCNFTPLINTAFWGNLELAELLIENGAEVNARIKVKDGAMCEFMGGNITSGTTPLHLAVFKDISFVELLVLNLANVNAKDDKGVTPLQLALKFNKQEIAEYLIKYGAAR